jgi:hypothetical protein
MRKVDGCSRNTTSTTSISSKNSSTSSASTSPHIVVPIVVVHRSGRRRLGVLVVSYVNILPFSACGAMKLMITMFLS